MIQTPAWARMGLGARRARLASIVLALALLAQLVSIQPASAQAPADPAAAITGGQSALAAIEAQVSTVSDDRKLSGLRDKAIAVQTAAESAATSLTPQLSGIDKRLGELGPAPKDPRTEAPQIRAERQSLNRTRTAVDGEIKQARLLSVAAQQATDSIAEQRRALFNQRIFKRGDSPLSPAFWTDLASNLPPDLNRLRIAAIDEGRAARQGLKPANLLVIGFSLLAALLIAAPVGLWLEALGQRWAINEAPATSLRRSGVAMWRLVVGTAAPGLAAACVLHGLEWGDALSARAHRFGSHAAGIVVWIALVATLGAVLLSAGRSSWRLAPLSDETARRARPYPLLVGAVSGIGLLLERLNTLTGASLAATVATNVVLTLLYATLMAGVLVAVGRGRAAPHESEQQAAVRSSAWSLAALAIGLAICVSLVATAAGYTAFGVFLMRQTLWISVLSAFVYLLLRFVDDLFTQLFCPTGRVGRALYLIFALRPSTVDQLGVLLSAVIRIALILLGISAVLAPFGAGAGALAGQITGLAAGVQLGGVTIAPAAVLAAVIAFAIGVALVRGIQRWLNAEYLPRTEWDPGVRNSVSTAVGYLGVGLAAVWALASLGLGLQRVALIASALSVGIGFGLQQIVQNFISGVILLVERPVKAGDWVIVGGVEGDIQRINVRATEILMQDRSTVILPNSEFITKAVQNRTRGDPLGRINVTLAVSTDADVEAVRDLLAQAFAANEEVLEEPAPLIFIDGVSDGGVQFNTFAYVLSPRRVYPVRSALFFDILRRLKAADIELAATQQNLRITAAPGLQALYEAGARPAADLPEGAPPTP